MGKLLLCRKNINKEIENEAINILRKNNIEYKCCMFSQGFTNPFFKLLDFFQLIYFLWAFRPTTVHSVTAKGI